MEDDTAPRPVREYRFIANLHGDDLSAFREALVDFAGGFTEIADDQGTRYEVVTVYGEWKNDAGKLIPDFSQLIRIKGHGRGTVPALRKFIQHIILATPGCDQDYIYLSSGWRGEFVPGT